MRFKLIVWVITLRRVAGRAASRWMKKKLKFSPTMNFIGAHKNSNNNLIILLVIIIVIIKTTELNTTEVIIQPLQPNRFLCRLHYAIFMGKWNGMSCKHVVGAHGENRAEDAVCIVAVPDNQMLPHVASEGSILWIYHVCEIHRRKFTVFRFYLLLMWRTKGTTICHMPWSMFNCCHIQSAGESENCSSSRLVRLSHRSMKKP